MSDTLSNEEPSETPADKQVGSDDLLAAFGKSYCDIAEVPAWEKGGKVHDWRNYIPDDIRRLWPRLSQDARVVAVVIADMQAEKEEWD